MQKTIALLTGLKDYWLIPSKHNDDERNYTVVIHHELGRKWSIYVAYLTSESLKSTLEISSRFQITENSVIFEFFIP
jgi:hypothetical protein